jgi:hypothetical protein
MIIEEVIAVPLRIFVIVFYLQIDALLRHKGMLISGMAIFPLHCLLGALLPICIRAMGYLVFN